MVARGAHDKNMGLQNFVEFKFIQYSFFVYALLNMGLTTKNLNSR